MDGEQILRGKLRKIEALFAGGATDGEKVASAAAAQRIRARLADIQAEENAVEIRFSLPDPWSRQLFIALCRRYGMQPYRYARMRRQSVVIGAPQSFIDDVLWPEFEQINDALVDYLGEITNKVIREEVFGSTEDAMVVAEMPQLGP
ncbi:MAG: hypothetical protein O2967_18775 [Proteobacteria bacterium]|nr:hypothetical protein [Pseudomonadota bacterium]